MGEAGGVFAHSGCVSLRQMGTWVIVTIISVRFSSLRRITTYKCLLAEWGQGLELTMGLLEDADNLCTIVCCWL